MAGFIYTAQRSLVQGHVAAEEYSLTLRTVQCDVQKPRRVTTNEALGGAIEQIFYNSARTWQITSRPLDLFALAAVEEFLDSVEAGETFQFDPYGSAVVTWRPRLAVRVDQGYAFARSLRLARGGQNDLFSVSFAVREV